jgi:hypothetical protein
VATAAGATVFAVVFAEGPLPDRVTGRLGQAGADKVLLCEGAGLAAPPLDGTHGAALAAAIDRVPPLMVLFPAGGAGAELGPTLAARIGAAFAGEADLELAEAPTALADGVGRAWLRRWRRDRSAYRRLDPVELERPVIGLLPAGRPPESRGVADIDVEVIACPPAVSAAVIEIASDVDDQAAVTTAAVLVVVAPALGAPVRERLAQAAGPGVVVLEGSPAAGMQAAAPRVSITLGASTSTPVATPRGRLGAVLPGGSPPPARIAADVIWRPPGDTPPGAGIPAWCDELADALANLEEGR